MHGLDSVYSLEVESLVDGFQREAAYLVRKHGLSNFYKFLYISGRSRDGCRVIV